MNHAVAIPTDYLPRYLCPHCNRSLEYADTDPDTHETRATCPGCDRAWIVTGSAGHAHAETGKSGSISFTMRPA